MPSLRDVQRQFGERLLAPRAAAIRQPGLRIYAANMRANWEKALSGAYPVVRKIVGEPFFEGLAHAYSFAHPSRSGDLNEFGPHFAAFLAGCPQTRDLAYLPDVAQMEWLAHRAHFAADPPGFDPARLAEVPPADYAALPLRLAPASSLLASAWPLARIWEIHQDGYAGELSVDFTPVSGDFLVHRPGWKAAVAPLEPADSALHAAAGRCACLGDALESARAADPRADLTNVLGRWIGCGSLVLR